MLYWSDACALSSSGDLYVSAYNSQRVVVLHDVLGAPPAPSVKRDLSSPGCWASAIRCMGWTAGFTCSSLRLNAQFIFLSSGSWPVLDRVAGSDRSSHPDS